MHAGNPELRADAQPSALMTQSAAAGSAPDVTQHPGTATRDEQVTPAGFSWKLPDNPSCARSARGYVRQALIGLSLPGELIDDAALAVSELAANAWQHATPLGEGASAALPELWLYQRGGPSGAELVCGVFDTRLDAWPPPPGSLRLLPDDDELADPLIDEILASEAGGGRGLGIVKAVSDSTGCHRTRSRLNGRPVPGKLAWFTMKIPANSPAAQPQPADLTSVQAAHALSTLLHARGIPGISHHHGTRAQSWVSIPAGFTVRCREGIFQWLARQKAFSDLTDVLEDVIRLHEELASAGRQTSG